MFFLFRNFAIDQFGLCLVGARGIDWQCWSNVPILEGRYFSWQTIRRVVL